MGLVRSWSALVVAAFFLGILVGTVVPLQSGKSVSVPGPGTRTVRAHVVSIEPGVCEEIREKDPMP